MNNKQIMPNATNHVVKNTSLRITELTSTSAVISWSLSGAKYYNLRINGQLHQCCGAYYKAVDLTPNTIYFVTVAAINEANAVIQQADVKFVTRIANPEKFELTSLTADCCTYQWQPVNGANGYLLYINDTVVASLDGATTTYQCNNLMPGTTYTIGVAAKHNDGFITSARTSTFVTMLRPPTNFIVTTTHMAAYLSWDLVLNATQYSIQCLECNTGRMVCEGTTASSTYTCYGLNSQTQYLFKIKACNANAQSDTCDISKRTLFPLPSTPVLQEITNVHSAGFTVKWEPVCDWDGTTQYHLYLNGEIFKRVSMDEKNTCIIRGLVPATAYSVALAASNKTGESALSQTCLVNTTEHLARPQQLCAEQITDHSCLLRWGSVGGATHYIILVNGVECATTSVAQYHLVDLAPNTMHKVTIQAANSLGASLPSARIDVRTLVSVPKAPTNLRISNISAHDFRVDWEQVVDAEFYCIYIAEAQTAPDNMTLYGKVSKNYIVVTNRKANVSYSVYVTAHNKAGKSSVVAVPVLMAPLAPSTINVMVAANHLTLRWPKSDGAVAYKIRINEHLITTGHLNIEWQNNILPNTQYNITVSAINEHGVESAVTQTTARTSLAMPHTPTGITTKCGLCDVTISWLPALHATHYRLYLGDQVYNTDKPGLSVANLEPGQQYQARVESINDFGVSHQMQVNFMTLFENPNVKCVLQGCHVILQWQNLAPQYRLYFEGTRDQVNIRTAQSSPIVLQRDDLSYCDEERCELQIANIDEPTKWQFAISTVNQQGAENTALNWIQPQEQN